MTKIARGIGPFIDVRVPSAGKDLGQTELVRPVIFFIRLVPRRPKNKRHRTVPPNDVKIVHGKILFSPVTGRRDEGLMFANHLLEIIDCLESNVVFRVAKIHKRPRVRPMLRNTTSTGPFRSTCVPVTRCRHPVDTKLIPTSATTNPKPE